MKSGNPFFSLLVLICCGAYLLCMVLWARSYFVVSEMTIERSGDSIMVVDGVILYRTFSDEPVAGEVVHSEGAHALQFAAYRMFHAQGSSFSIQIPFWFLSAACIALPLYRLIKILRLAKDTSQEAV